MFDFERYTRFLPELMLSPQGHHQHLSLGINLIEYAELCYPHDNIVGTHFCYECKKSIELSVCHRPENARSTNSSQIQEFQDSLRTYMGQFSDCFHFLLIEVVIIQTRRWNCEQLLGLFIRQLTISFNAFLSMSFHVVGHARPSLREVFPILLIFQMRWQ